MVPEDNQCFVSHFLSFRIFCLNHILTSFLQWFFSFFFFCIFLSKSYITFISTFVFVGHDTTAGGLTWTLYNIAKHPEYQRKAQEEVDAIMRDKTKKTIEW